MYGKTSFSLLGEGCGESGSKWVHSTFILMAVGLSLLAPVLLSAVPQQGLNLLPAPGLHRFPPTASFLVLPLGGAPIFLMKHNAAGDTVHVR